MTHKIELEDSDVNIIIALCDVGLKVKGIEWHAPVARILSLMPKSEPTPEKE